MDTIGIGIFTNCMLRKCDPETLAVRKVEDNVSASNVRVIFNSPQNCSNEIISKAESPNSFMQSGEVILLYCWK
jgi:hypothetical protein